MIIPLIEGCGQKKKVMKHDSLRRHKPSDTKPVRGHTNAKNSIRYPVTPFLLLENPDRGQKGHHAMQKPEDKRKPQTTSPLTTRHHHHLYLL